MVVTAPATYLLISAMKENVSVFVAVEALLDSTFSIIYFGQVSLLVYYNPVFYGFIGFAFGAKYYYHCVLRAFLFLPSWV